MNNKLAIKLSEKMNLSLNDFYMSMVSKALKTWFNKKNDADLKEITIAIPFTFKKINKKDFKYDNNTIFLPFYLTLDSNIRSACHFVKSKSNFMKNSLLPCGFYLLMHIISAFLPHFII